MPRAAARAVNHRQVRAARPVGRADPARPTQGVAIASVRRGGLRTRNGWTVLTRNRVRVAAREVHAQRSARGAVALEMPLVARVATRPAPALVRARARRVLVLVDAARVPARTPETAVRRRAANVARVVNGTVQAETAVGARTLGDAVIGLVRLIVGAARVMTAAT